MRIITRIIAKILIWNDNRPENTNNTFNSIRINALVNQLVDNGYISMNGYEVEVSNQVYDLLRRNKQWEKGKVDTTAKRCSDV